MMSDEITTVGDLRRALHTRKDSDRVIFRDEDRQRSFKLTGYGYAEDCFEVGLVVLPEGTPNGWPGR
jgi:hypothetical protein